MAYLPRVWNHGRMEMVLFDRSISISFGTNMQGGGWMLLLVGLFASKIWGIFFRALLMDLCSAILMVETLVHQVEILWHPVLD